MKSFYVARCWKGGVVTWEAWSYDKFRLIEKMIAQGEGTDKPLYYVSQKTCKLIAYYYAEYLSLDMNLQSDNLRAECERVKETQEETDGE